MSEDSEDFIFQQDGDSPHWRRDVRRFLNEVFTSKMDRSLRERRPGPSVLAPEIPWSHTLRRFLVGVRKRSSLCTISTNNFGRLKKLYHNCGELSDARHIHTQFYTCIIYFVCTVCIYIYIYKVSQEEGTKLRESVPYVKIYRYNPKHLYPKLNGYGNNGQRILKLWQLLHTYWLPNTY